MRLFIQHSGSHLSDSFFAEVVDELQRVAGVGYIVGDEHLDFFHVDEINVGRKHHRDRQAFVNTCVVLAVHDIDVFDRKCISQRTGDKETAAGDSQNHLGPVAVFSDCDRQFPGTTPVVGPIENLDPLLNLFDRFVDHRDSTVSYPSNRDPCARTLYDRDGHLMPTLGAIWGDRLWS